MNYLAIDIGGSAIKVGIVSAQGEVIEKMSTPTPMKDFEALMDALCSVVDWALSKSNIEGIALSQPCVTDAVTGQALSEGALIYISGTNPAKRLGDKYNLPYSAENDGNCAALAEVWKGGAKDVDNMALVVCGSGIGGSVVVDKKIVSGKRKFAGEFGMFIMGHGPEGEPQIWSELGATLALVKNYAKQCGVSPEGINGKMVFERQAAGDALAGQCIDDFFKRFAYGLHNIQHVYDPELILIGGAISERPDFAARIDKALDALYDQLTGLMSRPSVAVCTCGADANLIGAVYHFINKAN